VISNVVEGSANIEPEQLSPAEEKYPRGAKIGNVLHNTLEKSEFENFVSADDTLETLQKNVPAKLKNIIKEEFNAESLPLAAHEDEWMEITLRYLYNTLHANLPVIAGGQFVESTKTFRLVDLPENAHKPEVQFGLNAEVKDENAEALATLRRVCKGFIDLLFVRGEGDNKRYSILDWKSDFLEEYSPESVKEKVDEEYSVQRVLYSYCLIQWLKNFKFCEGMSEQEIFAKHFGGIYYAFLRGTDGKTSKGIYAQTWKDYATLEKAYMEVKKLMTQSAN
jgi:exodeoxyribonuclease V beta subunit